MDLFNFSECPDELFVPMVYFTKIKMIYYVTHLLEVYLASTISYSQRRIHKILDNKLAAGLQKPLQHLLFLTVVVILM